MELFNLGIVALVGFALIDLMIRVRMARLGHRWVFLLGGFFDYGEYTKIRAKHGWSAWPLRLMWFLLILGISLTIVGFFKRYGFHPPATKHL